MNQGHLHEGGLGSGIPIGFVCADLLHYGSNSVCGDRSRTPDAASPNGSQRRGCRSRLHSTPRERSLNPRQLELLARELLHAIRAEGSARLLINHRTDVALAVGADGVHLTGSDIAASDVRALAARSHPGMQFLIAASCHSAQQVRLAEAHGADFAVLAPIFEKINVTSKRNWLGRTAQSNPQRYAS